MIEGKVYIYENSIVLCGAGRGKRTKFRKEVTYVGKEGRWCYFKTDKGNELMLHENDIDRFIKEV